MEGTRTATESCSQGSFQPLAVKSRYDEIFETEIEGWCYGFGCFTGGLSVALVHRVVKELAPAFKGAIQHNYVFDVLQTARRLGKATNHVVDEKELVFSILVNLPWPYELDEDGQFVLAQVIDQAEHEYGGVLARLEKRWRKEMRREIKTH